MNPVRHTRVSSGIRLDSSGRFWHDGEEVLHPAIARAWHRGLERAPDGRYLIRFGGDWAYITVDDAPFVVQRVLPAGNELVLVLSNGDRQALRPETLARSPEGVLYCRARDEHRARFSRQAQADLGPVLGEEKGRFFVRVGNRPWPVGDDPGSPPPRPEDGPVPDDDEPRFEPG